MEISGWEEKYRSGERGREDQPTALLVETANGLGPGLALDLACGTGRNALYLAAKRWRVMAIDGSATAIDILLQRASERSLCVETEVADLTDSAFELPLHKFDLIVMSYYLQRSLFAQATPALRDGGVILAIVHTGPKPDYKCAAPGELRGFFQRGWEILHDYEGPSRDAAHARPVAEIVARLVTR